MSKKKAPAAAAPETPAQAAPTKPCPPSAPAPVHRQTEIVPIDSLRPHPRNYKKHPEDQLAHIRASLRDNGWYRNIVIAQEGTILAGHGVWEAAKLEGLTEAPVFRLPLDPNDPRALKVMTGDNELGKFAETDDRALTELLKEIKDADIDGLMGTGFEDAALAALVMVTRPASEMADFNAAAEYVGLPEYDGKGDEILKLVISFPSEKDRETFCAEKGIKIDKKVHSTWGTRWPWTEREDVAGLRFDATGGAPVENGKPPEGQGQ